MNKKLRLLIYITAIPVVSFIIYYINAELFTVPDWRFTKYEVVCPNYKKRSRNFQNLPNLVKIVVI